VIKNNIFFEEVIALLQEQEGYNLRIKSKII